MIFDDTMNPEEGGAEETTSEEAPAEGGEQTEGGDAAGM